MTGERVPATMMALRAHARGGPERLVYEQAPTPQPGPGEALVEVHAAAITFTELTWDQTWTTADGRDRTPTIPSHEVSGTVAALGPAASAGAGQGEAGVAPGDQVYGLIDFDRNGAAAQYVTLPAADLAARPQSVSPEETATLPLAALTAWQALVDHAGLKPGERVLITGGAGGVGSLAVQLAVAGGGAVTATGRAAQRDFVLGLGAGGFLATDAPHSSEQAQEADFDVVIDTVGGPALDASYPLTRRGGRLISVAAPPDQGKAAARDLQAAFFIVEPNAAELARLAALVDAGTLRPILSQTFPLANGREAFESARRPHPPGKTVLVVRLTAGQPQPAVEPVPPSLRAPEIVLP